MPTPGLPVLLVPSKTNVTRKRVFNEGACISFLLVHSKLPQTPGLNNTHALPHRFCGSGIWALLPWVLAQGLMGLLSRCWLSLTCSGLRPPTDLCHEPLSITTDRFCHILLVRNPTCAQLEQITHGHNSVWGSLSGHCHRTL